MQRKEVLFISMKTMGRKILYLFITLSLLLPAVQTTAAKRMTITAHTGAWDQPDNTMEFIDYALPRNPDIIEIDIRQRPDGSLAMSHDDIESNDQGEDIYKVFEKIRGTKIRMNLDIKMTETLEKLRALILEYGMQKQVFMTGLHDEDIPIAMRDCRGIQYYTNLDLKPTDMELIPNQVALIDKLKRQHSLGVNCHYSCASRTLCELLHKNGFLLSVWTVNEAPDVKRMLEIGVDNITTREPDVVQATKDEFDQNKIKKGKAFSFIQFTDPQFGMGASMDDDKKQMQLVVNFINASKPAFAVCTGDMVNELKSQKGADEYNAYQHRVSKDIPVMNVPGNHDIRELTPDYFDFYNRNYGEDRFSYRYGKCAFIGINSTIIQKGEGEMEEEQYKWLKRELKKAKGCRAIMLFSHIPLVCQDIQEADSYNNFPTSLRAKYLSLLSKYGVRYMFCGHLHKNMYAKVDDLEIITTNAVGKSFEGKTGVTVVNVGEDWINYEFKPIP